MEALDKLQTLAEKNRVPFEDLYDYVVKEITEFEEIKSERINSAKKIINFSNNHKELTNNE